MTHRMRVRLTSENFKGHKVVAEVTCWELNEKQGIIENNCTPTDGRSKGHIFYTTHKRNLARFGLDHAHRDTWWGKWTLAEKGWESFGKCLDRQEIF